MKQVMPTMRARGFTLIELVVTVAILAILVAVAIPSFGSLTLSSKLSAYSNALVSDARLARSEAVKRNVVVTMCVSSNGASCGSGGWETGWILTVGGAVIQRQAPAAAGFKLTEGSGVSSLDFQPTGLVSTAALIRVCLPAGAREKVVTLSATGRSSIASTATGVCS